MKWKTEKENPQAFLHSSGRWLCKFWLSMLTRRLLSLTTLSMGIATLWPGGVTPLAATTSTTAVVSDRTLKLIADSDGSHSNEDIIFGFNGSASNFEEVMRLNEDGMLVLGGNSPESVLDVRSSPEYIYTDPFAGASSDHSYSLLMLGSNPLQTYPSGSSPAHSIDYQGLRINSQAVVNERDWGRLTFGWDLVNNVDRGSDPLALRAKETSSYIWRYNKRFLTVDMVDAGGGFWNRELRIGFGHGADFRPTEMMDINGAIRIGDSYGNVSHSGTIRYREGIFEGYNGSDWLNLGLGGDNSFGERVTFLSGIQLGNTDSTVLGAMRFHDGDFEGYDGAGWVSLTESELTRSTRTDRSTDDIYLDDGHFGGDVSLTAEDSKLVFGVTGREGEIQDNYLVNSLYAPADHAEHFPVPEVPDGHSNFSTDDDGSSGGVALVADGLPRLTVKGNGNTYIHKRLSIGLGAHVPGTSLTVGGAVHIGPDNLLPTEFDYDDQLENYLLWVENGIVSEDFAIANVDNWSDHVFDEDYDLMSLENVAEHIEASGHLPGVPSASEVAENGYTVHGMTRILLEKIEELTLHTIEQDKAIRELKAQLTGSAKKRSTRSIFSRLR